VSTASLTACRSPPPRSSPCGSSRNTLRSPAEPRLTEPAIAASVGLAASLGSVLALSFLLVTPVSHSLMTELFGAAFSPRRTPFLILMANAGVILVSINSENTLLRWETSARLAG